MPSSSLDNGEQQVMDAVEETHEGAAIGGSYSSAESLMDLNRLRQQRVERFHSMPSTSQQSLSPLVTGMDSKKENQQEKDNDGSQ